MLPKLAILDARTDRPALGYDWRSQERYMGGSKGDRVQRRSRRAQPHHQPPQAIRPTAHVRLAGQLRLRWNPQIRWSMERLCVRRNDGQDVGYCAEQVWREVHADLPRVSSYIAVSEGEFGSESKLHNN